MGEVREHVERAVGRKSAASVAARVDEVINEMAVVRKVKSEKLTYLSQTNKINVKITHNLISKQRIRSSFTSSSPFSLLPRNRYGL
jgi:hypothetical protein